MTPLRVYLLGLAIAVVLAGGGGYILALGAFAEGGGMIALALLSVLVGSLRADEPPTGKP